MVAVWSAWIYNTWLTSWFDADRQVVRLALLGVMLASLVMSATLPDASGQRGLLFAGAYLAIQGGRSVFAVAVLRAEPRLRRDVQRIQSWLVASAVLWLAGGLTVVAGPGLRRRHQQAITARRSYSGAGSGAGPRRDLLGPPSMISSRAPGLSW